MPVLAPKFEIKPTLVASDVEVILAALDEEKNILTRPGALSDTVEKLSARGTLTAQPKNLVFVPFAGKAKAEHVIIAGLGMAESLKLEAFRIAGAMTYQRLAAEKCATASIQIEEFEEFHGSAADLAGAFAEGFGLSAYRFDKYKSQVKVTPSKKSKKGPAKNTDPTTLTFVVKDKGLAAELKRVLERVQIAMECITITRDWSNEPSNVGTPEYYASEAVKIAKKAGLKTRVLGEAEAKREGMHMFLSVGRGSDRESKVVVLEYTPKGAAKKGLRTVALVGKGVTFDTGGISIKPSAKMEDMKHDMTGAATVFGATLLAARTKARNRIVCVMGFVENMPSGHATTPSSVVVARNGKTVEIINTDAEGRLVLGDALDLAQDYGPDCIIDAATLTGAVGVALGKVRAGVMTNSQGLLDQLVEVANANHERVWQLPMDDEYFEDIKTPYADMMNSANNPLGGTIRGGIFLKQFIRPGTPWVHMDIAYTANDVPGIPYLPSRGATGLHVRTLAAFVDQFSGVDSE